MIANGSVEVLGTGVRYEIEGELWQLVDSIGCVYSQLGVRGLEISTHHTELRVSDRQGHFFFILDRV